MQDGNKPVMSFIIARLQERSTISAIITLILMSGGIAVAPEQMEAITFLASVVLGIIGIVTKEQK